MKSKFERLIGHIPAFKAQQETIDILRQSSSSVSNELAQLRETIAASRYPGLSASPSDMLTERLLGHPVKSPRPAPVLLSVPPRELPSRVKIAERLVAAYHKSLDDEKHSSMRREGEDLWTGLLRNELPELMKSIDDRDPVALSDFLMNFGKSYVWFGGITTCVDGYNKNLDRSHIALTYLDKLVSLAEYLGVIRVENPENGPWGDNLLIEPHTLVGSIEKTLGIDVTPPLGIIHTDGICAGKAVLHYRHINSLYSAIRVARLIKRGDPVCEIGGGIGLTAMYAQRLGVGQYTILDLPITCLLAGHYLLHALGPDRVCLYGEEQHKGATIHLLPYWDCPRLPGEKYSLVLNQDSLPEIADNLIQEFLTHTKRLSQGYFLSINQEYFYPRTVRNFVVASGGFKELYRSKCWVREGYVEELYQIKKQST